MIATLNFLRKLCVNNNKEWFDANRDVYKACKEEFETYVEQLIAEISMFDQSVAGLKAKDCTYRINRDIRFSPDKTPYKTHMGAFIAPGGKSSFSAGYYLHIEPDSSMIAGGIYLPPSDVLLKIRTGIYNQPQIFSSIVNNNDFKKFFSGIDGDTLKTAPKGFSKEFEYIDLLRFKSYTVSHMVPDEVIENNQIQSLTIEGFRLMKDFNSFLNSSL